MEIIITLIVILTLWFVFKVLRDDEWYITDKYVKKQVRWMKDQDMLDYDQKRYIQMILAEEE